MVTYQRTAPLQSRMTASRLVTAATAETGATGLAGAMAAGAAGAGSLARPLDVRGAPAGRPRVRASVRPDQLAARGAGTRIKRLRVVDGHTLLLRLRARHVRGGRDSGRAVDRGVGVRAQR